MVRNKITTACEECRTRKKKCDGKRPVCEPCREHDRGCHWTNYSGRSEKLTKKYISELETQVQRLQRNQQKPSLSSQIQPPSPRALATAYSASPLQDEANSASYSNAPITSDQTSPAGLLISESTPSVYAPPTEARPLQSLDSVINASLGKPRSVFGNASIGNFVSQIVRNVDTDTQSTDSRSTDWVQPFQQDLIAKEMKSRGTLNVIPGLGYALPPRKTADVLLASYWQYIHTIFPFVDRFEFERSYQDLWVSNAQIADDTMFLYLLNLIFALASRVTSSVSPEQRNEVAKTFVTRAQEAHSLDFWSVGDFQSVQALLLLGLHFHTTDPHYSWMAISMGTRIAQSLGLHNPDTSQRLPSIRARELVRRVWYGCVVMDCIVTQTYGRPSMLSKDMMTAVPLPLALEDAPLPLSLDEAATPYTGTPSSMDAFIQSIKMYEILSEILSSFYNTRNKSGQDSNVDYQRLLAASPGKTILSLERELTEWYEGLPPHLQVSQARADDSIFIRQAVILRQRYLQVRILLLRPVLRTIVANQIPPAVQSNFRVSYSLRWQLMVQCAVACIETAQESIKTIATHGPSDICEVGNVSTWMHNVLYLYTAATVLLTARICPVILSHTSEESISASWDNVTALLKRYEVFGSTAKRVVRILESLNTHLLRRDSRPDPGGRRLDLGNSTDLATTTGVASTMDNIDDILNCLEDNNSQAFLTDFFDLSAFELHDLSWMPGNSQEI